MVKLHGEFPVYGWKNNKGYATEAARALIHYGFSHLGIHRIIAHCDPENAASWKVLEKIGMRREGHFRKNVFFRRAMDNSPLWIDSFEYAILIEDMLSSEMSNYTLASMGKLVSNGTQP